MFLYAGIFALEVITNVSVLLNGLYTQLYFFFHPARHVWVQLVKQKRNKHEN